MNCIDSRIFALAGALLLHASGAHAQSTEDEADLALAYGDKRFVSIAIGARQMLSRAPSVASVITAEDIAAMGARELDEVLESVPGLHVSRSANSYSPLYVVRGVYSQFAPQVLLLQNGVPMTTLFTGNKGNLWGGYPIEHIARIEVIRGPGSALYGADAFSGVINIITKSAADVHGTEFGARTGSFRTRDAWVQHGGKLGAVDVAAYLRVGKTDGFERTIAADGQTRLDRLLGAGASLAPGPVNTGYDAVDANLDLGYEQWRLRAGYKLRDDLETGAGIASALDPVGKQRSERITADLSWDDPEFAPDWGVGFRGSYLHYTQQIPTDFVLFPAGANVGAGVSPNGFIGGPDTWERQLRLSAFATYTGFADHSLRVGVGHDDLNLYKTRETRNFTYTPGGALVPVDDGAVADFSDSNPFMRPQRRKVNYVYVQDEWNFARGWTLTAGLRHDRYSDFGGTTNPRAALVWDADLNLTVKMLYGRAFRAPAFNEVYGITNPVALGNAKLRPETIDTLETAFLWRARPDTDVNLSLFRYNMRDIIRTEGGTYFNTGAQRGYGGELELVWDATRSLRFAGSYAWQRSVDKSSDRTAGYAPGHQVYARADWRFVDGWLASTQISWVADRKRAAGDLRSGVSDYAKVDFTLRTANSDRRKWALAFSVRNAFNADIREPSLAPGTAIPGDLPMARRSVYLQASFRL